MAEKDLCAPSNGVAETCKKDNSDMSCTPTSELRRRKRASETQFTFVYNESFVPEVSNITTDRSPVLNCVCCLFLCVHSLTTKMLNKNE